MEDYTNKYKGEQVEVALFGGEYQEGVLTAYCSFEDVPHVELNGHILIPLQNRTGLRADSSRTTPETRNVVRSDAVATRPPSGVFRTGGIRATGFRSFAL